MIPSWLGEACSTSSGTVWRSHACINGDVFLEERLVDRRQRNVAESGLGSFGDFFEEWREPIRRSLALAVGDLTLAEEAVIFHNRQRRHSSLGMRTPIEYERIHHDNPTVALPSQAS